MSNIPQFNYNSRSFLEVREELINYVKQYYPDEFTDFTENSLGILFIELMAGVSDMLNYQNDKAFTETQLNYAQQRKSILEIAKNMGLKIPGKRASATVVDFSVTVPAAGDTYSLDYTPVIKTGTQVFGGGRVFEIVDDIDFSSKVSNLGNPNLKIIPNIDANQVVQNYTLTKREVVYNGASKIFKKDIRIDDSKPFLTLVLPDTDILDIEQIIVLTGLNNSTPSIDKFYDDTVRYYEVDWLLQDRIFIEDKSNTTTGSVKAAKWQKISKKFISEYTDKGFLKITFGGGNGDSKLFNNAMNSSGVYNGMDNYLQNTALGEIPPINSQIFIRYRVGGGTSSNVGANILTTTGQVNISVNGPENSINQQVIRSLKTNNPIPAFGGVDEPSIEAIRNMIPYNFSSQDRCVTLNDYIVEIFKMPAKYGSAFRNNVFKEDNKIVVSILGLTSEGKLDNSSTSILMDNIAEYLSQKRMINDYVEVRNGQIFNLVIELDLYIDENIPSNSIALNTINVVGDYFNIINNQMNTDIYLGNLVENINNVNGVLNILSLRIFNKVGNGYSLNEVPQPYISNVTRQIDLINNTLYSASDSLFEIKYPNSDIIIRLKKKNQLNNNL